MRVALDATPLTLSSGGLRRYVFELSRALVAAFPEDEYLLASDQPFTSDLPRVSPPRNALERRWWSWGLNRELARRRVDVFHGTNFEAPFPALRPAVLTLHDLSPWMDPEWHGAAAARVRRRTPFALRFGSAALVITPSEAVRRQAIDRFRIPESRIVAVPEAASAHFTPVEQPQGAPYFLFAGTLEPRKNLPMLLDAWRAARERAEVDLVLAGRRRADFPAPADEPGLTVLGEVSEERLRALYAGALAFLYPSSYEGFGLPVLEAMQCGAAVFASRDPAVAEVAGDAAALLDARDTQAWSEALVAAAESPEWIAALRAKALQRASQFSWERSARLTRGVYQEALRRGTLA